jgi:nitroreductase
MTTLPLSPDELLTTTRSVRKRLDLTRPVPEELVRECLEIALQAPSGSNLYRRAVESYLASPGSAAKLFADDPTRAPVQRRIGESVAYLGEHMGEVPVLLVPCLATGTLAEGNQAGLWGSLLPAVWSYMLAARARGLGTAWTTLHLVYEKEAAELLGLPDHVRQAALIPTAYHTGETFRPAARRPLGEVLHTNGW